MGEVAQKPADGDAPTDEALADPALSGSTCETVSADGGSRTPSPPTVSSSSIGTADEDHPGLCRTTRRRACHRPVQRDLRGESDTRHQSRGPGSQLLDRREHCRRDRRRRHRPGHSEGGAVHQARPGQWRSAAPPQSRQRAGCSTAAPRIRQSKRSLDLLPLLRPLELPRAA
jgi:hypothetical protein